MGSIKADRTGKGKVMDVLQHGDLPFPHLLPEFEPCSRKAAPHTWKRLDGERASSALTA
jgi:hypothetical protein